MKRPRKATQGQKDNNGWTANSDLFMAVAIVFLIMFVFALLASGASQIALQKEKIEAEKHLLGKLPDADKKQTEKQMAMAAKDIQDISQKKEFLKTSLLELAQMAETLESREESLKSFYETQNKNIAKIEQSRELIEKQAEQLKSQKESLNLTQEQLQKIETQAADKQERLGKIQIKLEALQEQRSNLQKERESLSQESKALKSQVAKLSQESEAMESENKSLQEKVRKLSSELESKRSEVAAAQRENKELSQAKQNNGQKLALSAKSLDKFQSELEALRAENKELKSLNDAAQKQLQASQGDAQKFEKRLQDAESKNQGLVAANKQLGESLQSGQSENKGLKTQLGEMGKKLGGLEGEAKELGQASGQLKKALGEKTAALGEKEKLLADLSKMHEGALGKLEKTNKEKEALSKSLASLQKDHKDLGKESEEMAQRLAQMGQVEKSLNDQLQKSETARVVCKEEGEKLAEEQKTVKLAAQNQKEKLDAVGKTLADARKAVRDIDNERKRIASNIANNLKASGVAVDVNPETGNITLRMDESFYFKNASFQLRDEAKQKIAQIMPIYAKTLLENPKIAQRIESILVTGYASPKFKKEYVDPASVSGEAYDYNLELSVNRAREIVAYMFGQEIEDYTFKDKMRNLVSVSGVGMMKAIPLESDSFCSKDPQASVKFEECTCGPYDCKRSRRVELQFVLKNQKDTDLQLQKISDKLIEKEKSNVAH